MDLVLASGSPRRRELLTEAGYMFRVLPPSDTAERGVCSGETPAELAARLARQKAQDVAARLTAPGVVIGCDTIVECDGQVLGKPVNEQHAAEMLRRLSGREHRVLSGLCVARVPEQRMQIAVDVSVLRMDPISPADLSEYLASGLWEGKAGAFGLQDRQGWVHVVSGSETNIVGLPMELLTRMLNAEGVRPR